MSGRELWLACEAGTALTKNECDLFSARLSGGRNSRTVAARFPTEQGAPANRRKHTRSSTPTGCAHPRRTFIRSPAADSPQFDAELPREQAPAGGLVKLGSRVNVLRHRSACNSHNMAITAACSRDRRVQRRDNCFDQTLDSLRGRTSWLTQTTDSHGMRTTHTGGRTTATGHMPRLAD
jgi:hypothetical protein